MIRALLARDPAKRMGSKSGAAELKKSEFLQDVKWQSIRQQQPPSLPFQPRSRPALALLSPLSACPAVSFLLLL
eukprot:780452-Rhodomonas_salina.3